MGNPDGIGHVCIAQGNKGNHIDGANPGMNPGMFAHINNFEGLPAGGETGLFNGAGGTDKSEDTPVMILIHTEVEELYLLDGSDGIHEGLTLIPVFALTEIGHTFNNFQLTPPIGCQ
jgi:hypothetical protein